MKFIVDPHIHIIDTAYGDYHWLKPNQPPNWRNKDSINRSVGLSDLVLSNGLTLQGVVHIEAGYDNRQPIKEIMHVEKHYDDFLLAQKTAEQDKLLSSLNRLHTIGFADITAEPAVFAAQTQQQILCKSCVGIRDIFDEKTSLICQHEHTLTNLAYLAQQNAIFELQFDVVDTQKTSEVIHLFQQVPALSVVISHSGFAPFKEGKLFAQWQQNLRALATLTSMHIKVSGFEMVHYEYTESSVCNVIQSIADQFGQNRMMLASNYPVVLIADTSYARYWDLLISSSSAVGVKLDKVACNNALDFYFTTT